MRIRGDLQGARGVGIIAILLGHIGFTQLHGAYVMLDMFFALSAYVITATLIVEHKHRLESGRRGFSVINFYIRRVKRIFPIAATGILVTVGGAQLIWNEVAARRVLVDGMWAFAGLANYNEMSKATDYFAQNVSHSPLQHYWTLSVEEQFYLVWPALMLVAFRLARRRWDWRASSLIAMAPLFIASFAYSIYFSPKDVSAAYFSPFTRGWEFALGGALAVAVEYPRFVAWFTPLRVTCVFLGGWVALISLIFLLPAGIAYPGAVGILPVLVVLMIIACGVGEGTGVMGLVDNRVLRYFGDISFSLYVFHWPVVVFSKALLPDMSSTMLKVVQLSVSVAIAAVAFAFIERPLRALPLGNPHGRSDEARARRRQRNREARRQSGRALVWTTCLTLVAAGVATQVTAAPAVRPDSATGKPTQAAPEVLTPEVTHFKPKKIGLTGELLPDIVAAKDPLVAGWLKGLVKSAGSSSSVNEAQRKSWAQASFVWDKLGWTCEPGVEAICHVGPATASYKVLIAGDSHAFQLADGLREYVRANPGVRVTLAAGPVCPFSIDSSAQFPRNGTNSTENVARCSALHVELRDIVSRSGRYQLTLVADGLAEGFVTSAAAAIKNQQLAYSLRQSFIDSVQFVKVHSDNVVLLDPMINWPDPSGCLNAKLSNWLACSVVPSTLPATLAAHADLARAAQIPVLHLAPLLCTTALCPLFHGDEAVTPDGVHVSQSLGTKLVPVLIRQSQVLTASK